MDQPVDDQVGEQRLHVRIEEGQLRVHRNITTEELMVALLGGGIDQQAGPQLPADADTCIDVGYAVLQLLQ
jgi:hypothetical protein